MFPSVKLVPLATRTTLYWVTAVAYRRRIWTLKMPPTEVMDATHPLPLAKEMAPVWDPVAVIGSTSLPTLSGDVGWHRVWFAVVVDVKVVVLDIVVENVVLVSA